MPTLPAFDLLLCLAGVCAGLLLLLKGLSYRYRGDEPHCARCDYNLTGVASEICPECGTERTPGTVVHGERYRRRWLVALGILLVLGSSVPGLFWFRPRTPGPRPSTASNSVRNAKYLITYLKTTFQAGAVGVPASDPPRIDILSLLVQDKIKFLIYKHAASQAMATAAQMEQQAAEQLLMSTIVPAYEAAVLSKKPEDARAMVPLMDQLDKHMDKLLQILKGY